ncbi:MAG: cation:proton antiporter [Clostridia bacterium]|nr:cation:proton antiporter [Clostridia bacterium]
MSGLLCGRLVKLIKLPNVTGYLIAGLVLGPYVTKVIPLDVVNEFSVISDMALSFIAFTIGCGFKRSYLKKVGMTPVVIAIFESILAVFAVQGVLLAVGTDPQLAVLLGAIAAATAPAATLMVIKQYGAKGPVTDTLVSVVALDDAVALMAFSVCVAIASVIGGGKFEAKTVYMPVIEIVGALLLGSVFGFAFKLPLRFFKKAGNRQIITVGLVFGCAGLANMLGWSSLLACMACGTVLCNVSSESDGILNVADGVTPALFLLFFATSGAALNITIIPQIGLIGIIYVFARVIGKIGGAWLGAVIMKAPKTVRRFLGPALVPQAGVAIGLTLVAQTAAPAYADQIRAVILCATLIYELVGPVITKLTLQGAGEITAAKTGKT